MSDDPVRVALQREDFDLNAETARVKGLSGATGGVVMHLADQATPQELRLKGSPSGKNYIGPAGPTPGEQDREIVSFDGRVLVTRFVDKDAAVRYGNMVYVRCAPRA